MNCLRSYFPFLLLTMYLAVFVSRAEARGSLYCEAGVKSIDADQPFAPGAGLGLGVHLWDSTLDDSSIRHLRELRPEWIRIQLGPRWREAPAILEGWDYDRMRQFVRDFMQKQDPRFRNFRSLRRIKAAMNVKIAGVIWEPPLFDAEIKRGGRGRGTSLPPSVDSQLALFYVAFFEYMNQQAINVEAIELKNEPDGDWNLNISPDRLKLLIDNIRSLSAIHSVELPPIAAPAVSSVSQSWIKRNGTDYIDASRRAAFIAVHAWDERRKLVPSEVISRLRRELDRRGIVAPILVTEYNITSNSMWASGPVGSSIGRGGYDVRRDPLYSARLVSEFLNMRISGASVVIVWELVDPSWGLDRFGLIDASGNISTALNTLKRISGIAHQRLINKVKTDCGDQFVFKKEGDDFEIVLVPNKLTIPISLNVLSIVNCDCVRTEGTSRHLCEKSNQVVVQEIESGEFGLVCIRR